MWLRGESFSYLNVASQMVLTRLNFSFHLCTVFVKLYNNALAKREAELIESQDCSKSSSSSRSLQLENLVCAFMKTEFVRMLRNSEIEDR
jgi:hypothetical protein